MGLVGVMLGSFISGMYTDRFGRKNAIVVWMGVQTIVLTGHAFMPNDIGFMIMRMLGTVTQVCSTRCNVSSRWIDTIKSIDFVSFVAHWR